MTTTNIHHDPPALDDVDLEAAGALAATLMGWAVGGGTTLLVDVGHRVGLFEAAAGAGPLTSEALAARIGGSARHVREWLGGMVTAGVFRYDAASGRYELPDAHAAVLTGPSSMNVAPLAGSLALIATHVPAVTRTLVEGGGIPYDAYRPHFTTCMDQTMRRVYDDTLLSGYVTAVDGLEELLASGVAVADIGCGTGHTTNLLAQAYPASRFVGYDIAEDALDAARAEASAWGLENVRFERRDVAALPDTSSFDVVVAFDCIHDQAQPSEVLAEVRRVLRPDGVFVAVDIDLSSDVGANVGNPLAPYVYTMSLFHCMQVSLAEGGAGLGAAWGRELAVRLLREAGLEDVAVVETPAQDPMNVILVGRAPA